MAELRHTMKVTAQRDAVTIRPGDTLLVRLTPPVTPEEATRARETIAQWMPDVTVRVIGADQVLVYRPNEPDRD